MSNWETVKHDSEDSGELIPDDKEKQTKEELVTDLVEQISVELKRAHKEKYDVAEAELTAALCLEAQKHLAQFLSDAELIAKERKMNLESIEGEKYIFYKYNYKVDGKDAKLSDTGVSKLVDTDDDVKKAKRQQIEAESDFSKWKNLFGILKDGHIFFRGIAKGKVDWT